MNIYIYIYFFLGGSPTRFHFGATEGYCFLWTLHKHLINILGFLAVFEINSCLGATQLCLFNRSLHSCFLNWTDLPCDTRTQYVDISDIYGKMEGNLLHHSLPIFKPWKLDRSSTRQDGGWEITDEIVRFLFAGTYFFSSTALFIVVEWYCLSRAQQVAWSFLNCIDRKIELQNQESVASILLGKTFFFLSDMFKVYLWRKPSPGRAENSWPNVESRRFERTNRRPFPCSV